MRNATPSCLDTFCRLDRLGLSVTAQHVEPDHTALRCRPTTPLPCPGCARPGVRDDAVLRQLVHVPLGWKPTILEVVVPRYRCLVVSTDLASQHHGGGAVEGEAVA